MTTFKGLIPSLGKLIQDHSDHNSTAFKPLTSITTETMAAPERTVSLSEIAAQHLPKDKDLRAPIPAINTPVNSGDTDTSFWDLRQALAPLLPPTSTPPVFRLSCPQALISQNSPSVFKPLTSAQAEAIAEKRASTSELVEQHLSMDMDLQSLPTTLIFSEAASASPSRLGTALCLSSLPKKSRKHHSESKVRAGTPPRCPSLTSAMFYLPSLRRHSADTLHGMISAAASKQQKTQEGKIKKEGVLVLWPAQIQVVKTKTFYHVFYHPLPKFTNPDPQRPRILPFKFDAPSPDDMALERRLKPYTEKMKSYRIDRRLNQA